MHKHIDFNLKKLLLGLYFHLLGYSNKIKPHRYIDY